MQLKLKQLQLTIMESLHRTSIKLNSGQMLVEIVVAIGIVVLVLVGVSDLTTRTTKMYRLQKEKDEANRLIEARLNQYRDDRDRDVSGFFSTLPARGSFSSCSWTYTPAGTYTCEVKYTDIAGQGVRIDVRASWSSTAGVSQTHSLSTVLTSI